MPTLPPNLLSRIKEQSLKSLKQRIKEEIAPITPDEEPPEAEEVPQGLSDRIRSVVKDKLSNLPGIQERMLDPTKENIDLPTIKYRLAYAGRNRLLVLMRYNGQNRHVEPYSWRLRGKQKRLYFFGFCRIHDKIHMFKPEKIQGCIVTDELYRPRNNWRVEL